MKNKILLNSGTLHNYGLNRLFEFAKKAGYDGIELIIDNNSDTRQAHYIKRLECEIGIKVLSVHSAMEFVTCFGSDPKVRAKESIEIAKKIKAKIITIHPQDHCDENFFAWVQKNYKKIIDDAKPVRVVFENHTSRRKVNQEEFFELFPEYTFDTSHAATVNEDIVASYNKTNGRVKHIHFSDSDLARRKNHPELIADRHMIPGTGKLSLKEFLQTLKKTKYSGYIVTELLPETIGAGQSDAKVLANLKKALKFIKDNMR